MFLSTQTSLTIDLHAWAIVLAAVLIAAGLFAYWRTTPELGRGARVALTALRVAALLCLVLFLVDPRAIQRGERQEAPHVVLLLDRSASMTLPATGWEGGESRFEVARRSADSMARALEKRGAQVETIGFDTRAGVAAEDSLRPDGQGTDYTHALEDIARRYEGEHLAGVVMFGDGVETERALVRPALPDLPVWTVGVGDTVPPEDVRIDDAEYSPVVHVPSRAVIRAGIAATGPGNKHVHVRLSEGSQTLFEADTSFAGGNAHATMHIPVRFEKPGRREMVLSVTSDGKDVSRDNNRRDIVIEAEKARARVLVMDLSPGWDMTFLTALVASDPSLECELYVTPQREAPAHGHIHRPDEFAGALSGADAVVLASVSDAVLTPAVTTQLQRFVERGGGLMVLPGPSSLFETPGAWSRLQDILPVSGQAPFSFTLQYTLVGPGSRASAHPVTAPLVPLLSQTEWQERSPLLGFYTGVTVKPSGEFLIGVRGRSVPMLAYGTAGKGRVAVFAAGPLWRWRFLGGASGAYDELMTRLLDVLTRGEESGRFVLVARKNVFDAGEHPVFYAEVFNEKLQPVTGVPVAVEVSRADSAGNDTPLERVAMHRERGDDTRLSATLDPLPAGRYSVRGSAQLSDRVIQSKPIELHVSRTSVEFRNPTQDRAALERIAHRDGGAYLTPDGGDELGRTMPLATRQVPVVSETILRASVPWFIVVLLLLSAEWLLRKRAGLI
ncbi:MAG TPA: hypothetical protein VFH88_11610 [Candidatus Krumholzibacteria bacterium]|nr:hypothetical protein [Candidatus Krumholzibacteria bacterium]